MAKIGLQKFALMVKRFVLERLFHQSWHIRNISKRKEPFIKDAQYDKQPFGLCRASSKDKKAIEQVLEGNAVTGFGERKRHLIEDAGRSDAPKTGDGASHAYRYGQPKELRDIL